MTEQGMEYNLSRLEYFLNSDVRLLRKVKGMVGVDVLLEGYSRLMDSNGCSREQLSRLYLIEGDYNELAKHVESYPDYRKTEDFKSDNPPHGPSIMRQGNITFQALMYTFWVFKIDSYPPIKDTQP